MARARLQYRPPDAVMELTVQELCNGARRLDAQLQLRFDGDDFSGGTTVYCAGASDLLHRPAVAIVGSRKASPEGRQRAVQLARDLVQAGAVVVSGLAMGIDTAAHGAALHFGGRTCAVLGTPMDRVTPVANGPLQETIWREHLLVTPFAAGRTVYPSNFPTRNRLMAALTDATVVIEASDTSGTLHQARECLRLGRHLFIAAAVAQNPELTWPRKFLDAPQTQVLTSAQQVLHAIERS